MTLWVLIVMVAAFALLITTHIALVAGFLFRPPRWRAALALVVPPLAPFWGFGSGMPIRSGVWLGALVVYAAMLLTSLR